MCDNRFGVSDCLWKTVKSLELSILSTEEIDEYGVVEILHPELYDKDVPKPNGLYDLRMGTVDKKLLCTTCNSNITDCQGHFGKIRLALPVYNILFIKVIIKLSLIHTHCNIFTITFINKILYTGSANRILPK